MDGYSLINLLFSTVMRYITIYYNVRKISMDIIYTNQLIYILHKNETVFVRDTVNIPLQIFPSLIEKRHLSVGIPLHIVIFYPRKYCTIFVIFFIKQHYE